MSERTKAVADGIQAGWLVGVVVWIVGIYSVNRGVATGLGPIVAASGVILGLSAGAVTGTGWFAPYVRRALGVACLVSVAVLLVGLHRFNGELLQEVVTKAEEDKSPEVAGFVKDMIQKMKNKEPLTPAQSDSLSKIVDRYKPPFRIGKRPVVLIPGPKPPVVETPPPHTEHPKDDDLGQAMPLELTSSPPARNTPIPKLPTDDGEECTGNAFARIACAHWRLIKFVFKLPIDVGVSLFGGGGTGKAVQDETRAMVESSVAFSGDAKRPLLVKLDDLAGRISDVSTIQDAYVLVQLEKFLDNAKGDLDPANYEKAKSLIAAARSRLKVGQAIALLKIVHQRALDAMRRHPPSSKDALSEAYDDFLQRLGSDRKLAMPGDSKAFESLNRQIIGFAPGTACQNPVNAAFALAAHEQNASVADIRAVLGGLDSCEAFAELILNPPLPAK